MLGALARVAPSTRGESGVLPSGAPTRRGPGFEPQPLANRHASANRGNRRNIATHVITVTGWGTKAPAAELATPRRARRAMMRAALMLCHVVRRADPRSSFGASAVLVAALIASGCHRSASSTHPPADDGAPDAAVSDTTDATRTGPMHAPGPDAGLRDTVTDAVTGTGMVDAAGEDAAGNVGDRDASQPLPDAAIGGDVASDGATSAGLAAYCGSLGLGQPAAVALSPDGSKIAVSSGTTGIVTLLDATGNRAGQIRPLGEILGLAWTPDGRALAVSYGVTRNNAPGAETRLWTIPALTSGNPIGGGGRLSFSRDGRSLLVTDRDMRSVQVWLADGTGSAPPIANAVSGIFSPQADAMALVYRPPVPAGGTPLPDHVRVMAVDTGAVTLDVPGTGPLAFSADGRRLASVVGNEVQVLALPVGTEVARVPLIGGIQDLLLSADGQTLVTASIGALTAWQGTTMRWSAKGDARSISTAGSTIVAAMGSSLTSDSATNEIRVLRLSDGTAVTTVAASLTAPFLRLSFSADGQRLGTSPQRGPIRQWRTDGTLLPDLLVGPGTLSPDWSQVAGTSVFVSPWPTVVDATRLMPDPIQAPDDRSTDHPLVFSPDGRLLALGADDGTIYVRNAHDMNGKFQLQGHARGVSSLAFSSDAAALLSLGAGTAGTQVRLWNVADRLATWSVDLPTSNGVTVMFAPDQRSALVVTGDGVRRLSRDDGRELSHLDLQLDAYELVNGAAVSGARGLVAVGRTTGRVGLWRLADGHKLDDFLAEDGHNLMTFSPDGTRLVTASGRASLALLWCLR